MADDATAKVMKGKSYLVTLAKEEEKHDEEESDDNGSHRWIDPKDASNLPQTIQDWLLSSTSTTTDDNNTGEPTTNTSSFRVYQWGDLDLQAFQINQQRLTSDEHIPIQLLDSVINERKHFLRTEQNIWTFDDWLLHQRTKASPDEVDVHVILEASVPPWELQLHRPKVDDDVDFGSAAECIRRVEDDEESDEGDDHDPSSDGIGSYLDYVYRRFMEEQLMAGNNGGKGDDGVGDTELTLPIQQKPWLHCVDSKCYTFFWSFIFY
jgi:hypothetical protein